MVDYLRDCVRDFCDRITVRQIDCDLTAWDASTHEACTDAVIGLRRELECSLMSPNCPTLVKQAYDTTCNPSKFFGNQRGVTGASFASDSSVQVTGSMFFLSFILLLLSVFVWARVYPSRERGVWLFPTLRPLARCYKLEMWGEGVTSQDVGMEIVWVLGRGR